MTRDTLLGTLAALVAAPMFVAVKIVGEFEESLKNYPPIKLGTPDHTFRGNRHAGPDQWLAQVQNRGQGAVQHAPPRHAAATEPNRLGDEPLLSSKK